MDLDEGRPGRRRIAAMPHGPTEIADNPAQLAGPSLRAIRATRGDFIAHLYARRRRSRGYSTEIGDLSPQLAPGDVGRRGPAPSDSVATNRDSTIAIRQSRIARRQFTGALIYGCNS